MVVVISRRLCEQHAELGRRMVEGEGCGLHVAAGIKRESTGDVCRATAEDVRVSESLVISGVTVEKK